MLILVEGVDKSGKSSLIKELSQLLNYPIIKNSYKPRERSPEFIAGVYAGIYRSLLSCYTGDIILDRSHITEVVYGRVIRDYDALLIKNWYIFEQNHLQSKAVLFYMTASEDRLKERFERENEEYVKVGQIRRLQAAYSKYIGLSSLSTFQLSSENSMSYNLAKAIDFIKFKKSKYGY